MFTPRPEELDPLIKRLSQWKKTRLGNQTAEWVVSRVKYLYKISHHLVKAYDQSWYHPGT